MALSDVFLRPLGLLALLAVAPLVALYLLRPDPPEVALPTTAFLEESRDRARRLPGLRRLRRNLLLVVQFVVLVLLAVSLASPYVAVPASRTAGASVVVLDASASMTTADGGGPRFARAVAAARGRVTETTTVVVAGADPRVAVRRGSPTQARRALADASPTGTRGSLAAAVRQATAVADADAVVHVYSDFAAGDGWRAAVQRARARGYDVRLHQVGGRTPNVGVVAASIENGRYVATVRNYGPAAVSRTVRLGDATRTLSLGPGATRTVRVPVPPGGGVLRLSPGDAFAVDDRVPVAAPAQPTVRVLLVTNGGSRHLRAALSVVDDVALTVKTPPATITREYDVVVFSGVDPDKLLQGTLDVARNTLARGGGVVVRAQPDVQAVGYGDLSLLAPRGRGDRPRLQRDSRDALTEGITFPAPESYVTGRLRAGRALLRTQNGTPLLAVATEGPGRRLYYGYSSAQTSFAYNYMYPVFWKRAVFWLTDRPSLAALNRHTGDTIRFDDPTRVRTPGGTVRTDAVTLRRVGAYAANGRTYAAALLDPVESNVTPPALAPSIVAADAATGSGEADAGTRPLNLSPAGAALAALLAVLEVGLLAYRGDL